MTQALPPAALLDIDGTLVDTNYHHAISWYRAFRQHDVIVPLWRVHRHIGMGGDQFVAAVAGDDVEEKLGDDIRAAESPLYMSVIEEVEPMEGARELLEELRDRGHARVLASSAPQKEVDHYLDLVDGRELADGWTTADDVEATKPEPDLIRAALEKASSEPENAVLIGDTTWDCIAAKKAGVPTVAVLTGGFSEDELREAGAAMVFESIEDLRGRLDETPLAKGAG